MEATYEESKLVTDGQGVAVQGGLEATYEESKHGELVPHPADEALEFGSYL